MLIPVRLIVLKLRAIPLAFFGFLLNWYYLSLRVELVRIWVPIACETKTTVFHICRHANILRSFCEFPSWKSFSIGWNSHVIETSLCLFVYIISPSSGFQTFWVSISIDIVLVVELRLRIPWHTLITKHRFDPYVVLINWSTITLSH